MNNRLTARCIDVNSQYCPCFLAETNHCFTCSHLKGGDFCDCNWTGSCILYEKHWQYKDNSRLHKTGVSVRVEIEAVMNIKQTINENAYIIELETNLEFANELKRPGSFVFLRCAHDPEFYQFPVGIMKVEGKTISVVIETIGPKSTRLFTAGNKALIIRGPYFNGVYGQPWIDNLKCGKILLIAGGMGQAPALPIGEALSSNENKVVAILAPGKLGTIFIKEQFIRMGVEVHTVTSMRRDGMSFVNTWFQSSEDQPDLVVSAGPDEQHYGIIAAMQACQVNIPMAATNNATMCCGEGVCGSCEKETRSGQRIRTCKVQLPFSDLNPDFS